MTDGQRRGRGDGEDALVVAAVDPDSVAARNGVRTGDLVVMANGNPVHSLGELQQAVDELHDRGASSVLVLLERGQSRRFVALPIA